MLEILRNNVVVHFLAKYINSSYNFMLIQIIFILYKLKKALLAEVTKTHTDVGLFMHRNLSS